MVTLLCTCEKEGLSDSKVYTYLANYRLYAVMHLGLCLSLFMLYGKTRVICTPTMAINNTPRKRILYNISIIERHLEFKPLLGRTKSGTEKS